MVRLTQGLWAVGLVLVAYYFLIAWLVYFRGPFQFVYNPVIAWLLDRFGMEAITIGARCYLCDRDRVLTPERLKHEEVGHFQNQWRRQPFTFIPQYLYELVRYGYNKMPMENAARADGGEPTR